MIDGFRIEMTADELIQHLDTRIRHHHSAASDCDTKRIRFEAVGNVPEDEDAEVPFLAAWPGSASNWNGERKATNGKRLRCGFFATMSWRAKSIVSTNTTCACSSYGRAGLR